MINIIRSTSLILTLFFTVCVSAAEIEEIDEAELQTLNKYNVIAKDGSPIKVVAIKTRIVNAVIHVLSKNTIQNMINDEVVKLNNSQASSAKLSSDERESIRSDFHTLIRSAVNEINNNVLSSELRKSLESNLTEKLSNDLENVIEQRLLNAKEDWMVQLLNSDEFKSAVRNISEGDD